MFMVAINPRFGVKLPFVALGAMEMVKKPLKGRDPFIIVGPDGQRYVITRDQLERCTKELGDVGTELWKRYEREKDKLIDKDAEPDIEILPANR